MIYIMALSVVVTAIIGFLIYSETEVERGEREVIE
jgi:hypothetical protein